MNSKHFVITPPDRNTALDVLGTKVTILASGSEVSDQRITHQCGAEGTGPPPHSHHWNESFYVSGGQIEFTCGGETTVCPAGTFVHVPAGTVHSFSYGPGGGEMIEITGPTSQAIEMFAALAALPPGPPDIAQATRALEDNGAKVCL